MRGVTFTWDRPGFAWPLGSFCGLDPDEHGQLWCEAPRVCCESCGKTYGLGTWVPNKIHELCPRCKAPVETIQESEAA